MSKLEIIDWGRTDYADAFKRQKERVERRVSGACADALIFTEHHPVYTTGMRKGASEHLIWDPSTLAEHGIEVLQSNRGGDITYHGPGQIIGYPILSLKLRKDLHGYLRDIEEVVIRTLRYFGLEASRRDGKTGIWLHTRKICAIGVAVRSWVTYHGFALNLNPDLNHFGGIVPCGITDGTITSMEIELESKVDAEAVKRRLAVEFDTIFANSENDDIRP